MARHARVPRPDYRGPAIAVASGAAKVVNRGIIAVVPVLVLFEVLRQLQERLTGVGDLLRTSATTDLAAVALSVALVAAAYLGLVGLGILVGSRLTSWQVMVGLVLAWVVVPATWLGWGLVAQGQESLWSFAPTYLAIGYVVGVLRTAPESIKVKWIVEDLVKDQTSLVQELGEDFSWVSAHLDLSRAETRRELREAPVVRPRTSRCSAGPASTCSPASARG